MDGSVRFPGDLFSEFDRLYQQMEQAFGPASAPLSIRGMGRGVFPPINIGSTKETVEVVAFAPGIDPGSLEVSIDKGLLTIAGERKDDVPDNDERVSVYAHERFAGSFRRVVNLPEDVDPDQVEATYQDGLLRITVRKHESSIPRRIEVK